MTSVDEHRSPDTLKAPGALLPLPDRGRPFPILDDHLVQPEVTRDEIIGGVRMVASPVELPHATQQSRLNYVVRAHVLPGYRVALELLTRFDEASDFTTDVCVFKDGIDPATDGRYLEEIAFEVVAEQNEPIVKEKAVRMHHRGVRRIFAIRVEDQRVCEWSPEAQDWRPLENAQIEDPCFISPVPVAPLFDADEADNAVAEALLAKRRAEAWARGMAEGRTEGAARSILTILEVRGIAVSPAQRQEILSCRDPDRLDRSFRRAILATSADEVLAVAPPKTGGDLLAVLEDIHISEETLDAIEGQIEARRRDPA